MMSTPPQSVLNSPDQDGRQCFLCGGKHFQMLHAWEVGEPRHSASIPVAVWKCDCGIVLLNPVPTANQLPEQGDWWASARAQVTRRAGFKRLRRRISRALIGSAMQRLIKDTRRVMPAGKILDVGCGTGTLLDEAAPFYQCAGLDPSEKALAEARKKGYEVILGTLEGATLPVEAFDVVVLYSVIEHVADPLAALKIVHRVLKPGGVVVLQTPKFEGPAYRRHGKGWNGFRVGYHTVLFTGKTLGRTMEQAGFSVLSKPKRDRFLDDILILWGRKAAQS